MKEFIDMDLKDFKGFTKKKKTELSDLSIGQADNFNLYSLTNNQSNNQNAQKNKINHSKIYMDDKKQVLLSKVHKDQTQDINP